MTCDKCGHALQVGDYPFCRGRQGDHGPSHQAIETDERFIGGLTVENLGHDPVVVYSRQELANVAKQRGLEQRIKYVPGDHFLTDWSKGIDPYTMAAAQALVERMK